MNEEKNKIAFAGYKKKTSIIILVIIFSIPLIAQSNFPGFKWEKVSSVEKEGFSLEGLAGAERFAKENLKTAAVVIIKGGKILYEWGDVQKEFIVHSVRKSFMSALFGIYVSNGKINLEKTLGEIGVDEKTPLTEIEKSATIRHCLEARSGIYLDATAEGELMRTLKPQRGSHKPGTFWSYNNWDFNVLYTIFEKTTEKKFYESLINDIAKPIGMEFFDLSDSILQYKEYSLHPAYAFKMAPHDLARFGLLMLKNGAWNGRQIIPENWVKLITAYRSDASEYGTDGYGYLWWVAKSGNKYPHFEFAMLPEGSYSARGAYGQMLIVIPRYDLVIVHMVNSYQKDQVSLNAIGLLLRKILAAGPLKDFQLPQINDTITARYPGEYKLREGISLFVIKDADRIFIQRTGLPREEIIAESENIFYSFTNSVKIEFVNNASGSVEKIIVTQLNRRIEAPRVN